MTDEQIRVMRDEGRLPTEDWEVHHKQGIELGGGNDDDNLMIFKDTDSLYHSAITTAQRRLLPDAPNPGDVIERAFPMFEGLVIFSR